MYPDLFGIKESSYLIMVILGLIAVFFLLFFYFKFKKISTLGLIDTLISGVVAVLVGFAGANVTQNFYNFLKYGPGVGWAGGLTFYGGLIFGVGAFLLVFFLLTRKRHSVSIKDILIVAPACITLAHAFGRIGCFLSGCCYGRVTDSWIGLPCSALDDLNHIPTQMYEFIFLFILSGVLTFLAFGTKFKYTFVVYMFAYSIFRFIIEFYRGDYRGGLDISLSPSQIVCIVIFILAVPTIFLFKYVVFKERSSNNEQEKVN